MTNDKRLDTLSGTVTRAQAGIYSVHVQNNGRVIECSLRGKLKRESLSEDGKHYLSTDPVSVGDQVEITAAEGEKGAIESIMTRKSKLSRIAAGPAPVEQVIVANADQMIMILSTKMPDFRPRFLDRLLIVAEAGGLEPVICINKMDLLNDSEREKLHKDTMVYKELGYRILYTTALRAEGVEELISIMKDKLSALAGQSGTGKSTILNLIQSGLFLRTSDVSSKTRKGKHTTTNVQLYPLDFGGYVVDTPGIRELGLWDVWKEEIDSYFPEMRSYLGTCKFHNCSHIYEPQCAIKKAVAQGNINKARYESYIKLRLGKSRDD